jgi:hypothetical protein
MNDKLSYQEFPTRHQPHPEEVQSIVSKDEGGVLSELRSGGPRARHSCSKPYFWNGL